MKKLLFFFLITFLSLAAYAQPNIVRGKVFEAGTKNPIPGANVIVKGTTRGVSTDLDGNFTLDKVSPGDVLEINYIGMAHVHKLVRKKACALVAEAGLGARRTRGGVNLVVQRGKAPFGQHVRAGAVQRRHGQRLPGLLRGQHGGHVVLRHGKKHVHRMHLRERGQGRGAGNKVARVHRPQAHAARDGRGDEIGRAHV